MDKHGEYSHKTSLSGKLVSCIQSVYCGSDYYLIVKTNNGKVIFAEYYWNGYTDWPLGIVAWENNDIFVDDRIYLFYEKDGLLSLMNSSNYFSYEYYKNFEILNIIKESFYDTPMFWRDEIHLEHRLVKYKRNETQIKPRSYDPYGRKTEFNCELEVIEDIQNEYFKRWKSQDKCRIFTNLNGWNIQEKSWDSYKVENVYY